MNSVPRKIVNSYLKTEYGNHKYILCFWDAYHVNVKRQQVERFSFAKAELTRREYSTLLKLMLEHPGLTFQDLPLYISKRLYANLMSQMRLPVFHRSLSPNTAELRTSPLAIELASLQKDAQKILEQIKRNNKTTEFQP